MNKHLRCPILMLNYGGWDDTLATLAAMSEDRRDVWLIDNASPVDRSGEIRAAFPEVRLIKMERNWGYAGAYNRVIAIAANEGHEAVFVLNNDAVPHGGAISIALSTLFASDRIAAVGSMMLHKGGRQVFFDGAWFFHDEGPLADDAHTEVRQVRQFHGGAFALKTAAYAEVGSLHEDYFLYHEETDWCLRAHDHGWSIVVDGRSRVDHEGGGSNKNFNANYYMARNRFLAMRREIELRDRPETRWSIVEYEALEAYNAPLGLRVAVSNGLLDGWVGRFGPRAGEWPRILTVPLAIFVPPLMRARRKLRHLMRHRFGTA